MRIDQTTARDLQLILSWVTALHSWEYELDFSDREEEVAKALIRLANISAETLQSAGLLAIHDATSAQQALPIAIMLNGE